MGTMQTQCTHRVDHGRGGGEGHGGGQKESGNNDAEHGRVVVDG